MYKSIGQYFVKYPNGKTKGMIIYKDEEGNLLTYTGEGKTYKEYTVLNLPNEEYYVLGQQIGEDGFHTYLK